MTILLDLKEARRIAESCSRPNLHFVEFSVPDLLRETRREIFPDIHATVSACFVMRGPLACVTSAGSVAHIYLHQVLNHAETPREVIGTILNDD